MELQRVEFFVWIFDESVEQAAERAKVFVSLFPYERDDQFSADEITDEKIASSQYPGWQLERFVDARRQGVHYGFFAEDQKPDGLSVAM